MLMRQHARVPTCPAGPVRSYGIPIDHTDRWIGARFLPVDHYRALHLILTEGLVESALAVTGSAARLRAATRRLAEEQDPGLRPLVDAILKIVESGLVDLQAEHQRIVRHALRRAIRDLGLG
jgi:hypothetical protein